jgi:hypothetical protein
LVTIKNRGGALLSSAFILLFLFSCSIDSDAYIEGAAIRIEGSYPEDDYLWMENGRTYPVHLVERTETSLTFLPIIDLLLYRTSDRMAGGLFSNQGTLVHEDSGKEIFPYFFEDSWNELLAYYERMFVFQISEASSSLDKDILISEAEVHVGNFLLHYSTDIENGTLRFTLLNKSKEDLLLEGIGTGNSIVLLSFDESSNSINEQDGFIEIKPGGRLLLDPFLPEETISIFFAEPQWQLTLLVERVKPPFSP